MKKMTKGAIVTGLGVALLLGGGGTLAVWNAQDAANIGIVTAGDLDLKAEPGVWSSSLTGAIGKISGYKIIPGEKLTYTQKVNVTLVGNAGLKAKLTIAGIDQVNNNGGFGNSLQAISYDVTDASNQSVMNGEVKNGEYTASATFTFEADGDQATNATLDLSPIAYRLDQVDPAQASGATGR